MTVMTQSRRLPASATTKICAAKGWSALSLGALLLTSAQAFAAPDGVAPTVTVTPPDTGSTTVVEQYSDGNVATITATPNGIELRNGMPYAVTQVSTVPRYTVSKTTLTDAPVIKTTTVTPVPSTATQISINNTANTAPVSPVTVTTVMPVTSNMAATPTASVQSVTAAATPAVIDNTPALTNQLTSTLDALQLNPTFNTPGVVKAQTKIMKILKDASGQEFAVPANHIAPGDVIEYRITYLNTTAQPLSNVNATVNLPNGVKLVSLNSPLPTQGLVSNGVYQPIGQVGNTTVIQDQYSGLQWNLLNLAPNASETVIMRATIQ